MAYWDLTKENRELLKKSIIARESMVQRGINPHRELRLSSLQKQFSLTGEDMRAVLKAFVK